MSRRLPLENTFWFLIIITISRLLCTFWLTFQLVFRRKYKTLKSWWFRNTIWSVSQIFIRAAIMPLLLKKTKSYWNLKPFTHKFIFTLTTWSKTCLIPIRIRYLLLKVMRIIYELVSEKLHVIMPFFFFLIIMTILRFL